MMFNPEDDQARYLITFPRNNTALSASKAPGMPLVQSPINRNPQQQWRIVNKQDGLFTIISANNGLVLTAHPRGEDPTVILLQNTGEPGQQWKIQQLGMDGQYVITSALTSMNLLTTSNADGAPIITAPEPLIYPPMSAVQIQPV